jgi:mRNA-degrading endonuclease toxin of MazEF toxin-antitoxin module
MNYTKGDIIVIPVPFTDNTTVKKRPAVVVSNDDVDREKSIVSFTDDL